MRNEKTIEIAYEVFTGRDRRLTWKRKIVAASKLEQTIARLKASGDVREIRTREA